MESFKEYLVFTPDYQTKFAFFSLENPKRSFTVDIDWDYPLNNEKPKMFLESANNEEFESKQNQQKEEKCVHNIAVAEDLNLLAFTTNNKSLFLCKIEESSCKVLSRRYFLRTSSCLRFCGEILYLADKTGDVYEYLCDKENYNKAGRWIFGHISQILDLAVCIEPKYVITSDRDEKIRVSNSQAYHEIESFCLGHRQFVSSLIVLPENLLLSISGDATLRLWNLVNGKDLYKTSFTNFTPILFKHLERTSNDGILYIATTDHAVKIYDYQVIDGSALKLCLLGEKDYSGDIEMAICKGKFYVQYIKEGKFLLDTVDIDGKAASFATIQEDMLAILNFTNSLNLKIFKSFDVTILFKSTGLYDNVKDYIERKKARIESQALKKKQQ